MILRTLKLNANKDSKWTALKYVWCVDNMADRVLRYNCEFSCQVVR